MKHFKKILEFQKLLKDFNQVYRDLGSIHKLDEDDNDVEHSFRVAMLCWMIAEEYKLKLDLNKVIKYALVHDLTEVYAGDMSIYSNYKQEDKEEKEHKSFLKLKKKFPKQKAMWKLLETYEKRKDEESKFVYIIEKLEPILVVILTENDHWIKRNITLENFIERKQRKIKHLDSFAQIFTKEILEYIQKNKKKYFEKKETAA
jgi:5'-deoxynucleotidase YfbR-like HD superfamily hydrolase